MHETSIIILIYQNLGSVRPIQQKIELPSPYWYLLMHLCVSMLLILVG